MNNVNVSLKLKNVQKKKNNEIMLFQPILGQYYTTDWPNGTYNKNNVYFIRIRWLKLNPSWF